jgi:hypothetical protein
MVSEEVETIARGKREFLLLLLRATRLREFFKPENAAARKGAAIKITADELNFMF